MLLRLKSVLYLMFNWKLGDRAFVYIMGGVFTKQMATFFTGFISASFQI